MLFDSQFGQKFEIPIRDGTGILHGAFSHFSFFTLSVVWHTAMPSTKLFRPLLIVVFVVVRGRITTFVTAKGDVTRSSPSCLSSS
jgi:hypothetical protein